MFVAAVQWFISAHGSDDAGCGETSSCQTLDWLFSQMHKNNSTNSSMIITDCNLVVDNTLWVRLSYWEISHVISFSVVLCPLQGKN